MIFIKVHFLLINDEKILNPNEIIIELNEILIWSLTVIIVKATLSLKYVLEDNPDYLFMRLDLEGMSWLLQYL